MTMYICDCCLKERPLIWVCLDDNYETEMCRQCISVVQTQMSVEELEYVWSWACTLDHWSPLALWPDRIGI